MLQIFEFFFLLYLNLSYESSSQNRRITWSLSFCWFRHAQSATRKYLDELRGSRQILQLHRWQLAPMAHAMWLCEMRLVGILCLWKLFVGLHVLLTVPGFFFWGSTWSCLEDASINLLSSQIDKCMCTVLRLPVFCLWNQGGFLFFWESKAGVVHYDVYVTVFSPLLHDLILGRKKTLCSMSYCRGKTRMQHTTKYLGSWISILSVIGCSNK